MAYTIEQTSRDVVTLRHNGVGADWRQRYLLLADVHFDSPYCNRRLLRSLLQEAQETGAGVFVLGTGSTGCRGGTISVAVKATCCHSTKRAITSIA